MTKFETRESLDDILAIFGKKVMISYYFLSNYASKLISKERIRFLM